VNYGIERLPAASWYHSIAERLVVGTRWETRPFRPVGLILRKTSWGQANLWLVVKPHWCVFFYFGHFEKWFSQIDHSKTYSRSIPFKGCQTCRRPYWTKERQELRRPSFQVRTSRNRRTSKLLTLYLNWRAALMLVPCFICDLCYLV
jgi:hypothetical protein